MRCPKCGSEMYSAPGMEFGFESCPKCDGEQYEKLEYQQRLDKVLEKFEELEINEVKKGNTRRSKVMVKRYKVNNDFNIIYKHNNFYLNRLPFESELGNIHKLDTVEHILKDMEAK